MIVLDTHAWIWWAAQPSRLSSRAKAAIEVADELVVCPISCWEVAMLVKKGRITFDRDTHLWVQQALGRPKVSLQSLTPSIAVRAGELDGGFHGDPADRLIAATALEHSAAIVSKDERLRRYRPLRVIW